MRPCSVCEKLYGYNNYDPKQWNNVDQHVQNKLVRDVSSAVERFEALDTEVEIQMQLLANTGSCRSVSIDYNTLWYEEMARAGQGPLGRRRP